MKTVKASDFSLHQIPNISSAFIFPAVSAWKEHHGLLPSFWIGWPIRAIVQPSIQPSRHTYIKVRVAMYGL